LSVGKRTNYIAKRRRAGYTGRKFLYEARFQEETSCNGNAWQSESGCTVKYVVYKCRIRFRA